ncbi:MAG TPA: hypothetical protein VF210_03075 [Pseudomonadales bacterium]
MLLTACSSLRLDYDRPDGFDLSGTWQLIEDESGTPPSQRRLRSRGGMLAFVTSDFPVLRAREMRIEQSRDSMGIRYDTGDYRDVSWGSRRRGLWEVRAGWHEGALYILSDAVDAEAMEILTLSDGGRRLDVHVRIESGGDDVEVVRVFRR